MVSIELKNAINGYENFISEHGISEDVINAYVQATKVALQTEKDREYGLKVSERAKELVNQFIFDKTGGTPWDLEKFAFKHKTYYDILNTYYDILLCEAQNRVFDSYLLYLERNREPKERFYAPKRPQFQKFGLIEAYQGTIDDIYDTVCVSMPPGTGKAQPLYSKVLTPDGFVEMGSIKVGDKVISGNGNVAKVLGVYPQGEKDIYEITLDDGSKCRCSDEHLWKVQTIEDRKSGKYRIVDLKSMVNNYRRNLQSNYSIDYIPKINFSEKKLEIHPYLLGYLLGDGCFKTKNIGFATADIEIVEKIKKILPDNHEVVKDAKYNYRIKSNNGSGRGHKGILRLSLENLGLFGLSSHNKFIPDMYLYSDHESRIELLRGLLDSDGSVCSNGTAAEFTSISKKLSSDVADIVHSLGGYASVNTKKISRREKENEKTEIENVYRVIIEFPEGCENPFFVKRKSEKFRCKKRGLKRFIHNIEYIGKEKCQCIYIDDPTHLYVTDDYIITHNTTLLKFFVTAVMGWFPKDYNLFYSHSGDITRMFYDGCLQIVQDSQEYSWGEIFTDCKITSTNAKQGQFNINSYKPFPSLQTASVGSENAGKVRASKFLLVDDMIGKLEEALNKNTLDKQWGAYTVDARQRKTMDSNDRPCKEIINATRWSVGDVIGRVIQMYQGNPRVKVVSMPATDNKGNSNFDYEYGGFTKEFFADQQLLMDDISYQCLFMQQPIEREGLLFPEDKIRRYLNLPHGEPELITAQCDTKGKGTDFFVLPVLQNYGDDLYYCVDAVCDNTADYEMQYENAANILVNNKVQECEFERNAGGDRVAMEVNKRVESKGWICNITDVPTETNKEARIFQCSSWILQHVIFKDESLYTPKEPYGIMMSLLKQYSVSGKKQLDDVPDVFSNFALRVQKKERKRQTRVISSPV